MIKSLTRASLLALFSTTIFAAAAIAPPLASADWKGEITPGAEQPAGQAMASGFADEKGLILIPVPAQVGGIEEVNFRGTGAVRILVTDVSDRDMQIWQETPPDTGLQLKIRTVREATNILHDVSLQRVDQTGAVMDDLWLVTIPATDGDVKARVMLTGSFDCLGTICNGPQNGELLFSLKVLAPSLAHPFQRGTYIPNRGLR